MTVSLAGETMTQNLDESGSKGPLSPFECSGNRLVMVIDVGGSQSVQFPSGRQ